MEGSMWLSHGITLAKIPVGGKKWRLWLACSCKPPWMYEKGCISKLKQINVNKGWKGQEEKLRRLTFCCFVQLYKNMNFLNFCLLASLSHFQQAKVVVMFVWQHLPPGSGSGSKWMKKACPPFLATQGQRAWTGNYSALGDLRYTA